MKKSFLACFLSILTAGILLGFSIRYIMQPEREPSVRNFEQPPRFGINSATTPREDSTALSSSRLGKTKVDHELKRYGRMSTEELRQELTRICRSTPPPVPTIAPPRYSSGDQEQQILIFWLCTKLGQDAPRQTIEQLKELRYSLIPITLNSWAAKNPEAALTYCRERLEEDADKNADLLHSSILLSARLAPEKNLLTPPNTAHPYAMESFTAALSEIARKSPAKMEETVNKLMTGAPQSIPLESLIVPVWAKTDWEATLGWINTRPEKTREMLLLQAVNSLPADEAMNKLNILNKEVQYSVINRIAASLFRESTEQAVEWLQAHVPAEQAAEIIKNNIHSVKQHTPAFTRYLDELPAGSTKDAILNSMLSKRNPNAPEIQFLGIKTEDSLALINQISSPETRNQAIEYNLLSWTCYDPEAIKTWLEKSDIPEDQKKKHLSGCDFWIKKKQQ